MTSNNQHIAKNNSRVISFLCFSLLLVSTVAAESNSNKPLRSQQRHVKLSTASGIKGRGSPSVASGTRATDSKNSKMTSKTKPNSLVNLKLAATAVKDEVIDIVESIVFAENGSERLENTIDIIRRHKFLLTAGSAALVLKTQIGGKGAKELGSEVMNDLRRKEIAKWGSRAGR